MKVILKADVKGTGKKGDLVDVSDGYARNFLLKKGLAEVATTSGINEITQRRIADEFHRAEYVKAQKELAAKLNGAEVTVAIKAGENGRVFGSVTTAHIASALEASAISARKCASWRALPPRSKSKSSQNKHVSFQDTQSGRKFLPLFS